MSSGEAVGQPRRILVIGAHPDDCEVKAGGSAVLWRRRGHQVCFVSMTDGRSGHHLQFGDAIAARRADEAAASGRSLGVEYRVLSNPDGALEVNLQSRGQIVSLIREFQPDIVFTHRPNDYHPDHRYTAQLVQDAAYMVVVPAVAPETPPLRSNPVFAYLDDSFTKPLPLKPDFLIPIDDVLPQVIDALHCHTSQMYEWLPYVEQVDPAAIPADEADRKAFLTQWYVSRYQGRTVRYRQKLIDQFGSQRAERIRNVEAFEISEYGSQPSESLVADLFKGY